MGNLASATVGQAHPAWTPRRGAGKSSTSAITALSDALGAPSEATENWLYWLICGRFQGFRFGRLALDGFLLPERATPEPGAEDLGRDVGRLLDAGLGGGGPLPTVPGRDVIECAARYAVFRRQIAIATAKGFELDPTACQGARRRRIELRPCGRLVWHDR
jgi:hypothetical protein